MVGGGGDGDGGGSGGAVVALPSCARPGTSLPSHGPAPLCPRDGAHGEETRGGHQISISPLRPPPHFFPPPIPPPLSLSLANSEGEITLLARHSFCTTESQSMEEEEEVEEEEEPASSDLENLGGSRSEVDRGGDDGGVDRCRRCGG